MHDRDRRWRGRHPDLREEKRGARVIQARLMLRERGEPRRDLAIITGTLSIS
jgi:hypothetical protein